MSDGLYMAIPMGDLPIYSFEQEGPSTPFSQRRFADDGKTRLVALLIALAVIVFVGGACMPHKHVEHAVYVSPHSSRHHHTGHHGLNSQEPDDIRIGGEKASGQHEGDEIPYGQVDDDNVDAEDAQDAEHVDEAFSDDTHVYDKDGTEN